MKLLGSNKSKITKHENGENVTNLEITEIVLVNCNKVKKSCKKVFTAVKSQKELPYVFY